MPFFEIPRVINSLEFFEVHYKSFSTIFLKRGLIKFPKTALTDVPASIVVKIF